MIGNPELQRNFWLELTPRRLALAAIAFVGIFSLAWVTSYDGERSELFRNISELMIGLTMFLWGTRAMADSVLDEVAGGTWDGQRMSALTPLQMTIGKILGAPSLVYLIVLVATGIWFIGYQMHADIGKDAGPSDVIDLVRLLLSGLAAMLLAYLVSLAHVYRGGGRKARFQTTFAQIAAILFGIAVYQAFEFDPYYYLEGISPDDEDLSALNLARHAYTSLIAVSIVWIVIASTMLMRRELQIEHGPWIWIAFILYWPAHVAVWQMAFGTDPNWRAPPLTTAAVTLFAAATSSMYVMAFFEPKGYLRLRQFATRLQERDWRKATWIVPRSWVALPFVAIGLALGVMNIEGWSGNLADSPVEHLAANASDRSLIIALQLFLFAVRDLALIYVWTADGTGRSHIAAFIYLALLYGIIPGILWSIDTPAVVLNAFWVALVPPDGIDLFGPGLGCAIALLLFVRGWRRASRVVPAER